MGVTNLPTGPCRVFVRGMCPQTERFSSQQKRGHTAQIEFLVPECRSGKQSAPAIYVRIDGAFQKDPSMPDNELTTKHLILCVHYGIPVGFAWWSKADSEP